MRARQWKITRRTVPHPEAQRRWDQAYQSLLSWTSSPTQPLLAEPTHPRQEEADANCGVRPRFDPELKPGPNH